MRNVLRNTNEVFHYWANQVQPSGQAASVFFAGAKVYSYGRHFCIARLLPSGAVAFTTRGYSITTAKHIGQARSAVRHRQLVFCNDPEDSADQNMRYAREAIKRALDDSEKPRIRTTTRERLRAQALHLADEANAYLAALPGEESAGVQAIDTTALEAVRAQLAEAAAAAKRIAEEQQQARMAELQISLTKWRAGEVLIRTGLYALPPALRLSARPDGPDVVETSHGAEIPLADALKLWPMVQRCRKGCKDFTPGEPIGVYRLTKIRADGSVVIGCHDIAYSELERIAAELELTAEA